MSSDRINNRHQRNIYKRIIVKGTLVLDTPTCLGSGDSYSLTDLALLRDSVDEDKALLTGASIAGALRNYLRDYAGKYNELEAEGDLTNLLFGSARKILDQNKKVVIVDDGDQSPLIVNDSISAEKIDIELRDGVKIDGNKGVAVDGAKYDFELLSASTKFPLFFELLIEEGKDEAQLKQALAIALSGFDKGEIAIGMKKRRGFGRCHVEGWQVWQFDLKDEKQRFAWLAFDRDWADQYPIKSTEGKIEESLALKIDNDDKRDRFTISAKFSLVGSMLIRSAEYSKDKTPDAVHLKSKRDGELKSIISGTSLAGVLRHRAVRIVKTLNQKLETQEGREPEIVEQIFGFVVEKLAQASRLTVEEKVIENPTELVQTRIAIDRFTGGALHGALFDAQPVFNGEVKLELELRNPKECEIGLLLLLLKDLWTGDLPIGGESSIGRGRLKGKQATLNRRSTAGEQKWEIKNENDNNLKVKDLRDGQKTELEVQAQLQQFVIQLTNHIHQE